MRDRALKRWGLSLGMLVLLGVLAGLSTPGAHAHAGKIVSSDVVRAGPYTMDVLFYASPQVGQPIPITIAPRPVTADGRVLTARPQLQATLQPAPGMSASEIRLRVYEDPDQPAFYAVDPVVEERGVWVLQLTVEGEAGSASGSTKVVVAGVGGPEQPQAAAPAPTPVSAAQGLNLGLLVPLVAGVGVLVIAGWWLLRRPAPGKATPTRRRR